MRRMAGVLLALLPVALLAAGVAWMLRSSYLRGGFASAGSSFRSDAEGSRALFLLLEEMGHAPVRLSRRGDPGARLLLCLEPLPAPAEANRRLLDWVQEGGLLVLAGAPADQGAKEGEGSDPFT